MAINLTWPTKSLVEITHVWPTAFNHTPIPMIPPMTIPTERLHRRRTPCPKNQQQWPPQNQMESHKSQAHAHPRESINSVRVLRVKTLWQAPGPPRVPRAEAACEPLAHNSPILSVTERLFMLSFTLLNHRGETLRTVMMVGCLKVFCRGKPDVCVESMCVRQRMKERDKDI